MRESSRQRVLAPLRAAPEPHSVRRTGGGVHVPSRASSFGQYRRIIRMNSPSGAGSQLACLSPPGDSVWMYRSIEPSRFSWNLSRELTEWRLRELATRKYSLSYIVSDQNP